MNWDWPKKKRFNQKTIAIIAVLMAVTIVFVVLEGVFPKFSTGGTIEIHFLPIILVSFITGFLVSFTFGIITSLLAILLVPSSSGWLINPVQVILDYNLPYIIPALVINLFKIFFFKNDLTAFNNFSKSKKIIYLEIVFIIIFLINFVLHVISGALYFAPSNSNWQNWKVWANSLVLNSYYMVGTYLFFAIFLPIPISFLIDYYQNSQNINCDQKL
ncbi:energy-coupled thiamine transporter ThiT [Mycoplasma sp. SG1]|uniref:energy-coupled thiamine transporter ThiT n=1 Tax=Mycoplasma sp. SG1 TaxID=2810348 RepID=UPI002025A401|nr:energy-coupled thiamine transporter ThiT [Mycoplasma sp. SG1]URM53149.1 energy-coupled thiamine transporter ThiT [Mycoplasma sp. SG1]